MSVGVDSPLVGDVVASSHLPSFMLRVKTRLHQTGRWRRSCVVTSLKLRLGAGGPPSTWLFEWKVGAFCSWRSEVMLYCSCALVEALPWRHYCPRCFARRATRCSDHAALGVAGRFTQRFGAPRCRCCGGPGFVPCGHISDSVVTTGLGQGSDRGIGCWPSHGVVMLGILSFMLYIF